MSLLDSKMAKIVERESWKLRATKRFMSYLCYIVNIKAKTKLLPSNCQSTRCPVINYLTRNTVFSSALLIAAISFLSMEREELEHMNQTLGGSRNINSRFDNDVEFFYAKCTWQYPPKLDY